MIGAVFVQPDDKVSVAVAMPEPKMIELKIASEVVFRFNFMGLIPIGLSS